MLEFTFEKRLNLSNFGKFKCKFENFRLEIWSVQKFDINLQSQN